MYTQIGWYIYHIKFAKQTTTTPSTKQQQRQSFLYIFFLRAFDFKKAKKHEMEIFDKKMQIFTLWE